MYKKMNKILGVVIVGVIFLMSMGYSVLNRELNISGELTYRPEGDIRITDVTLASTPENTTLLYSDFSKKQINIGFKSSEMSAKIAFTIEVTNFTDTEMGILGITDLPDIAKVSGYTLKNKLVKSDGSPLKAGESTTFTITFNPTVNNTYEYILKFDFEPVCKITYNGFKDTTNFKNEVLYGDTFTQDFGSNATKNIEVTMNGVAIENYTYSNNVLTISNVTGDILIDGNNAPAFIDSCEVHPNVPELNGDMIPVVYDEENEVWVKQSLNKSYDYCNQIWANAVTIVSDKRDEIKNAKAGTTIPMDYINTMWVWIPRYSYTIKSEDEGTNYFGKASSEDSNPTKDLPGEIDVKFIPTSENDTTGSAQYIGSNPTNWRTNDAFNFDGAKAGIWVAKFETTGTLEKNGQACENTNCNVSNVTVKPGEASLRSQTVSSFFYMARSMQENNASTYGFDKTKGDLHMMKNDEWGAVAYLSQSRYGKYGNSNYSGANKEVYINNNSLYITGTSGGSPSARSSEKKYEYNDMTNNGQGTGQAGPGASTTGTIYGVYDMSGGAWEYVMGVLEYDSQTENEHPDRIVTGSSGFTGLSSSGTETGSVVLPNEKYYNTYKSANPTSYIWSQAKPESACKGGVCYGHALSETYGTASGYYGWYGDYAYFVSRSLPWFMRGGVYSDATAAGVFYVNNNSDYSSSYYSSRLVFVQG